MALKYAERGWKVFPVLPDKKIPYRATHGVKDATSDPEEINAIWEKYPNANIGIATGKISGIVVLDVDPRNGGNESLDDLIEKHGPLPETIECLTPNGGKHLYFLYRPGLKNSVQALGAGLDIKTDGGYVVASPSTFGENKFYEWELSSSPDNTDLAPLPDWIYEKLKNICRSTKTNRLSSDQTNKIPEGTRNNTLTSYAGSMRRQGMDTNAILAALKVENSEKCDPPLPEKDIERIVNSISRYAPDDNHHLDTSLKKKPTMSPRAFYGILGKIVKVLEPESEADPAALLLSLIIGFGNCVSEKSFLQVSETKHRPNLFSIVVGKTAMGRKGTSWSAAKYVLKKADPEWADKNVSGLSSGEGIIHSIRDQITTEQSKSNSMTEKNETLVSDKRLMIVEAEFSQAIKAMERQGNTLSPVLRQAWDCEVLGTLTKNSRETATEPRISLIAQITLVELLRLLSKTEQANGFANRFLFCFCERSKLIANPVSITANNSLNSLISRLSKVISKAKEVRELKKSSETEMVWEGMYERLSAEEMGIKGALIARGPVQVLRLAMVFALSDGTALIEPHHLEAAFAIWQYSTESIDYIYGDKIGDPVAQKILEQLKEDYPKQFNKSEIMAMFSNHKSKHEIGCSIKNLLRHKLITEEKVQTGGRPSESYQYANKAKEENKGACDDKNN